MKKFTLTLFFMVLILSNSFAGFIKAELQASGLTCSMCSFATMKSLKTLSFVDSVTTDLQHTKFILYFNPIKQVDLDKIKSKVINAGFSVADLKVFFNFKKQAADKDVHFEYSGNIYHFIESSKKELNGIHSFKVMDKGFIPEKLNKKLKGTVAHLCYISGKSEACCPTKSSGRVYHISI